MVPIEPPNSGPSERLWHVHVYAAKNAQQIEKRKRKKKKKRQVVRERGERDMDRKEGGRRLTHRDTARQAQTGTDTHKHTHKHMDTETGFATHAAYHQPDHVVCTTALDNAVCGDGGDGEDGEGNHKVRHRQHDQRADKPSLHTTPPRNSEGKGGGE